MRPLVTVWKTVSAGKRPCAINPGAASTKLAVYEDEKPVFEHKAEHRAEDLKQFVKVFDQYDFRLSVILGFLKEKSFDLSLLDAAAGRGGPSTWRTRGGKGRSPSTAPGA